MIAARQAASKLAPAARSACSTPSCASALHAIRVPDAAGDLVLQADLRGKKVVTSVLIDAPGDGRPLTRVKWLLRQLKDAPDKLAVETSFVNTKATRGVRLNQIRENAESALLDTDLKRPPRAFRLALSGPMEATRGKGERSFVVETRKQAVGFYRDLVQDLRPWRPAAPKLPEDSDESGDEAPAEFAAPEA